MVKELPKIIGPPECFLDSCVGVSDRFLSTQQREIRRQCKFTDCQINIDSLKINPDAELNLINNCFEYSTNAQYNATKSNLDTEENFDFTHYGWFSTALLLFFLFLF